MGKIGLQMDYKEIVEGRRVGIPENIMGKMIQGYGLTESEKNVVNKHGKVYVVGHTKERGIIMIKPQLRNLPRGKKSIVKSSINPKEDEIDAMLKKYRREGKEHIVDRIVDVAVDLDDMIDEANRGDMRRVMATSFELGYRMNSMNRLVFGEEATFDLEDAIILTNIIDEKRDEAVKILQSKSKVK